MTPITFFARGIPKAQPRPKAFARKLGSGKVCAGVYTPGTAEAWKSNVAEACKPFVTEMLMEPVAVTIVFALPRPKNHFTSKGALKTTAPVYHSIRPDIDNLVKSTTDAMTMLGLLSDDCIIVRLEATKRYADDEVFGARITIEGTM